MPATLRYRGDKNNLIELAKNLDAFKKVPEQYTETTEIGGTLSLLSRLLIIYLIYTEICYYIHEPQIFYHFEPDIEMDEPVQMHVDITIAMPCSSLSGVDLMDETQQDVFGYGTLQRDDTRWEMKSHERVQFEAMQMTNHYLREQYHSIADILFKDIMRSTDKSITPEPEPAPAPFAAVESSTMAHNHKIEIISDIVAHHAKGNAEQYDACRLHGTLNLNKVAGVLHLVGGAQPIVGIFGDHFMIEFKTIPTNFTHRINRLSFGQHSRRIVQPLEGDETLVPEEATTVQYFLKIVPTEIHRAFSTINTYQYSVTENVRKLDAEHNSYGSPGIYFKYDWSALKIVVRNGRENVITFAIRLCSIIAGIIVISGLLNSLLLHLKRNSMRKLNPQLVLTKYTESPTISATSSMPSLPLNNIMNTPVLTYNITNDLLSAANQMSCSQFNGTTTFLHNATQLAIDATTTPNANNNINITTTTTKAIIKQ